GPPLLQLLARVGLPDADGAVLAGGDQALAVGAPGNRPHAAVFGTARGQHLAAVRVPDQDLARALLVAEHPGAVGAGGDAPAIGAEAEDHRRLRVSAEAEQLLTRGRLPEADRAIEAVGGQLLAVRAEDRSQDALAVAGQDQALRMTQ